jgi:ATPase subunit of ABC transporter with duplicated ATPase domains
MKLTYTCCHIPCAAITFTMTTTCKQVYDLGLKVEKVMDMMGFIPEDGVSPVSAFSGGWRMRIGLGKILLQDPNILLLDEPTNHLVSAAAVYNYTVYVAVYSWSVQWC